MTFVEAAERLEPRVSRRHPVSSDPHREPVQLGARSLTSGVRGHRYSRMLSHRQVEFLLEELCVVYGLCLAPTEWDRLLAERRLPATKF